MMEGVRIQWVKYRSIRILGLYHAEGTRIGRQGVMGASDF